MSTTNGKSAADLKRDLETFPEKYSFYQIIRLLRLLEPDSPGGRSFWDRVRFRPALGLSFPRTDVRSLERQPSGDIRIEANFFGLYGVASPLPLFYTEDLIELEMADRPIVRKFLDLLHAVLYPLVYEAWEKYRPSVSAIECGNRPASERFYAFSGLGGDSLPDRDSFASVAVKYSGLLTQFPRSAKGLETILSDLLGGVPVRVLQCFPRRVPIPPGQRTSIGLRGALGEESILGEEVDDRANQIRIRVGPVDDALFLRLLPGSEEFLRLVFWIRFYLSSPIMADMEIVFVDAHPVSAMLGGATRCRLGLDAWMDVGGRESLRKVVVPIPSEQERSAA